MNQQGKPGAIVRRGSVLLTGVLTVTAAVLVIAGADNAPGQLGDHGIRGAILAATVVLIIAAALPGLATARHGSATGRSAHPPALLIGSLILVFASVLIPWPEAFHDGEVLIQAISGSALAIAIGETIVWRGRRTEEAVPVHGVLLGAAAGTSLLGGIALGATIGLGAVVLIFGGASAANAFGLVVLLLLSSLVVVAAAFSGAMSSNPTIDEDRAAPAPHIIGPCRAGMAVGWLIGSAAPGDLTALPGAVIGGLITLGVAALATPQLARLGTSMTAAARPL